MAQPLFEKIRQADIDVYQDRYKEWKALKEGVQTNAPYYLFDSFGFSHPESYYLTAADIPIDKSDIMKRNSRKEELYNNLLGKNPYKTPWDEKK